MKIIWSEDAVADYHQNIEYLIDHWSASVATEFIEDVEGVVELIQLHPELFPLTSYRQVRKVVIRKQVTLFFEVLDSTLYLIRFWNNYQNPEGLRL